MVSVVFLPDAYSPSRARPALMAWFVAFLPSPEGP